MPIPKGARLAVKVVGIVVGVAVTLFAACLAINLPDEELTPTARSLLAVPQNPYRSGQQTVVALLGFTAPSHRPAVEDGTAGLDAHAFHGDAASWASLTSSIWSAAKTRHDEVLAMRDANRALYDRYLALHGLPAYFETAPPGFGAPLASVPQAVRALFLADVATRVQTGTRQQQRAALTDLQEDLLLWKVVLRGSGTLVSKMLAAAALRDDLLLIGDFVTDPQSDPTLLDGDLSALVTPFDITDWQIDDAFAAEMRSADFRLRRISREDASRPGSNARPASGWNRSWNGVQGWFFKLHATENLEAERMAHLRALADANPDEFSKASAAYRAWAERRFAMTFPRTLYNPIGRILLSTSGAAAYEDYIRRVYDVAATQRLVCLVYQIRRQDIATRDVAAFMAAHPAWATHPIDREPFRWDAATRIVTVMAAGAQDAGRRFSLAVPAH